MRVVEVVMRGFGTVRGRSGIEVANRTMRVRGVMEEGKAEEGEEIEGDIVAF